MWQKKILVLEKGSCCVKAPFGRLLWLLVEISPCRTHQRQNYQWYKSTLRCVPEVLCVDSTRLRVGSLCVYVVIYAPVICRSTEYFEVLLNLQKGLHSARLKQLVICKWFIGAEDRNPWWSWLSFHDAAFRGHEDAYCRSKEVFLKNEGCTYKDTSQPRISFWFIGYSGIIREQKGSVSYYSEVLGVRPSIIQPTLT